MTPAAAMSLEGAGRTAAQRLLSCLELLQSEPVVTGEELAAGIDVDTRTVRRYVAQLRELGIPVEGDRGAGGGYRLRSGGRARSLMLDDEEVEAIVLGLLAAQQSGLGSSQPGLLAKLRRGLHDPARARRSSARHAVDVAEAIERRRRIVVSPAATEPSAAELELSPFALVRHLGRLFLVAHDHGERQLRTLPLDAIDALRGGGEALRPGPGFDARAEVLRAVASDGRSV